LIQNPDVAQICKKVSGPLEIEDESRFKIKAYRDASRLWTDTRARRLRREADVMLAVGTLLVILGLVGMGYGIYALVRGGRNHEGGLRLAPERAIHAVAGIRMLIGGAVAIFLGAIATLASLSG
jgi:hypothetical protein